LEGEIKILLRIKAVKEKKGGRDKKWERERSEEKFEEGEVGAIGGRNKG
jgi:hypothetical protein